jgi:hypothetical protein
MLLPATKRDLACACAGAGATPAEPVSQASTEELASPEGAQTAAGPAGVAATAGAAGVTGAGPGRTKGPRGPWIEEEEGEGLGAGPASLLQGYRDTVPGVYEQALEEGEEAEGEEEEEGPEAGRMPEVRAE